MGGWRGWVSQRRGTPLVDLVVSQQPVKIFRRKLLDGRFLLAVIVAVVGFLPLLFWAGVLPNKTGQVRYLSCDFLVPIQLLRHVIKFIANPCMENTVLRESVTVNTSAILKTP